MEKQIHTVSVRLDDATLERLDNHQRAAELRARVPLSRSLVLRALLLAYLDSLPDEVT